MRVKRDRNIAGRFLTIVYQFASRHSPVRCVVLHCTLVCEACVLRTFYCTLDCDCVILCCALIFLHYFFVLNPIDL